MSTKNSTDIIGNLTHYFLTRSTVPQPTVLPLAPPEIRAIPFLILAVQATVILYKLTSVMKHISCILATNFL